MIVKTIEAGPLMANCYILFDENAKEVAVMDPGGNANEISSEIEKLQADVKYIILTHGHFDHVGGVSDLIKKYDVPVYISKIDKEYCKSDDTGIFGKIPDFANTITEGDILRLGKEEIKVIETPGHTKGGVSFYVSNMIFTGDTLFRASIGRTDFLGGNFDEIINSIIEKIIPLGDEVEVYPGHGPKSTVAYEKRNNPYLD